MARVLGGLKDKLMAPELVAEFAAKSKVRRQLGKFGLSGLKTGLDYTNDDGGIVAASRNQYKGMPDGVVEV